MECTAMQNWLLRKIDGDLTDGEKAEVDAHLAQCTRCVREYKLLTLPNQMAQAIPAFTPSPYFSRKVTMRVMNEAQSGAAWQAFLSPARRMIPALAGITFALLSIFAYVELSGPETDTLYTAYEKVFLTDDRPHQILIAGDISDEAVLSALAERETSYYRGLELK
jgi:anti-sigma factor RsiW